MERFVQRIYLYVAHNNTRTHTQHFQEKSKLKNLLLIETHLARWIVAMQYYI